MSRMGGAGVPRGVDASRIGDCGGALRAVPPYVPVSLHTRLWAL
jgi:hypothetical protein